MFSLFNLVYFSYCYCLYNNPLLFLFLLWNGWVNIHISFAFWYSSWHLLTRWHYLIPSIINNEWQIQFCNVRAHGIDTQVKTKQTKSSKYHIARKAIKQIWSKKNRNKKQTQNRYKWHTYTWPLTFLAFYRTSIQVAGLC